MDVFPRRNLPNEAEPWGRRVEDEVNALDNRIGTLEQFSRGQNRNTASSLEMMSRQINALPITAVFGERETGFSVGSSYTNKVSLTIPAMTERIATVFLSAEAGVEETDDFDVTDIFMRIIVNSEAQPDVYMPFAGFGFTPGGGNRSLGTTTYSVSSPVGDPTTIDLQVRSVNPSMTPARGANYATIYAMVSYSGSIA